MLSLTLKLDEVLQLGPDITITVARLSGERVRLHVSAPRALRIDRFRGGQPSGKAPVQAIEEEPSSDLAGLAFSDLAALNCIDRYGDLRAAPGSQEEKHAAIIAYESRGWITTEPISPWWLTAAGIKERNRLACQPLTLRCNADIPVGPEAVPV